MMKTTIDINGLRSLYLRFFADRGHAVIPSASLAPDNDPSVLFTTAGMHPLVPYLGGQEHPAGKRLASYQKCLRTSDIDEVGDDTHLTCFEMLGNWSLGDYGKRESIAWSYEFLTSPDYLGIPLDKLWVTVFAGNADAPRDEDAAKAWREHGLPDERIVFLGAEHNWWAAGTSGPCGPDTEIFFDRSGVSCGKSSCLPSVCDCERFVEIWNNVFMSFDRRKTGLVRLPNENIDTGMGLERTVAVLRGVESVFDLPELQEIRENLVEHSSWSATEIAADQRLAQSLRVIIDHLRSSVFVLGDTAGIQPSNQGAGYVLRRLIRRAVRLCGTLGISANDWCATSTIVVDKFGDAYPELSERRALILDALRGECDRFEKVRVRGTQLLKKEIDNARRDGAATFSGSVAFTLYDTFGFPIELTEEMAREHGLRVDREEYAERFKEHRERSRHDRARSGLADESQQSVRYHTATHLLHAALRDVLGDHVEQRGSNITHERMRFDFSHPRRLADDELRKVESWVQECIDGRLPVTRRKVSLEEARGQGAIGLFGDRYDGEVFVYEVEGKSLEVCSGPHVANTGELGTFSITKEQSASAGVRRIRAVLTSAAPPQDCQGE